MRLKSLLINFLFIFSINSIYCFSIQSDNTVDIKSKNLFNARFVYSLTDAKEELNCLDGFNYFCLFQDINNFDFSINTENLILGGFSLSPFLRILNNGNKIKVNNFQYFNKNIQYAPYSKTKGFSLNYKENFITNELDKKYFDFDINFTTILQKDKLKLITDMDFFFNDKWGLQTGFVFFQRNEDIIALGDRYYLDLSRSFSNINSTLGGNFFYLNDFAYIGIASILSFNPFFKTPGIRILNYGVFELASTSLLVANIDLLLNCFTDCEFNTYVNDFRGHLSLSNNFTVEKTHIGFNIYFDLEYLDRSDLFFIFDSFDFSYLIEFLLGLNRSQLKFTNKLDLSLFQDKAYESVLAFGLDFYLPIYYSKEIKLMFNSKTDLELNYKGRSKINFNNIFTSDFKFTRIKLGLGYKEKIYWSFSLSLRYENINIIFE